MTTAEVAHPKNSLLPVSVIQRAGEVIERIRHSEMISIEILNLFVCKEKINLMPFLCYDVNSECIH